MAQNKVEKMYTVRISYDITLRARDEMDAIRSAQYSSLAGYREEGKVRNLSEAVIRTEELPKSEPVPQPEHSEIPQPVAKHSEDDFPI